MYSWITSWFSWTNDNFGWMMLLLVLQASSFLGLAGTHYISKNPGVRPHNREKFVNEWLGRSHLAYLSFYLTIFIVQPEGTNTEWVNRLFVFLIIIALIFWFVGLSIANTQDKIFKKDHDCRKNCDVVLPWKVKFKVFGFNLIMAIIALAASVIVAFSRLVSKIPH